MSTAKTYLQDELNQKEPLKIIKYFRNTEISTKEPVLAVVGSLAFLKISSSLVVLEDRLVFANFLEPKSQPVTPCIVSFLDYASFDGATAGKNAKLSILKKNGERIETGIIMPREELNKLNNVIVSYREQGTRIAEQYKQQGIITIHRRIEEYKKDKAETIALLEATCDSIAKKTLEKPQLNFEKGLEQYSHIPNLQLTLTYCGGLDDIKSGGRHDLYINHLKRTLIIMRPFKQPISIPFANIKGAAVKREDGIPQNELTYSQQCDEYRKEQEFFITVNYVWNGHDASVTFESKQTRLASKDNVFVMEYILNKLPELAKYFSADYSKMQAHIADLINQFSQSEQDIYENCDTLAETCYTFQYCGGFDSFCAPGEAKLTLDHTSLKMHLPQPAPEIAIPLQNILDSTVEEDCPVEYPDPNDDSIFYIRIRCFYERHEHTLLFSHKQKHMQINDPVKKLDYLLHKRIEQFHVDSLQDTPKQTENAAPHAPSALDQAGPSLASQLRELKALLDEGILTQEEFDAKKKQLLNL
jgi:hypothetical protein